MIKLNIEKNILEKKITDINKKLESNNKILNDIGLYFLRRSNQCFKNQTTPDNIKWAPFSPNTLYYIRKKDNKRTWKKRASSYLKNIDVRYSNSSMLLQDTGTLKRSIDFLKKEKNKIEIGTTLFYAVFHQKGDKSKNLPARPFIGITNNDKKIILEMIKNFYAKNN